VTRSVVMARDGSALGPALDDVRELVGCPPAAWPDEPADRNAGAGHGSKPWTPSHQIALIGRASSTNRAFRPTAAAGLTLSGHRITSGQAGTATGTRSPSRVTGARSSVSRPQPRSTSAVSRTDLPEPESPASTTARPAASATTAACSTGMPRWRYSAAAGVIRRKRRNSPAAAKSHGSISTRFPSETR
jgi:hypothetical protein